MHPGSSDDPMSSIVRYLAGELSEREEIDLLRTLEEDPEQRQLYERLRVMWERSALPAHDWDPHTALERIKRQKTVRVPPRVLPQPSRAPVKTLLRLAAAIVVVFGLTILWRTQFAAREFSTLRGQQTTIRLADGSRLVLAADSRLRVPAAYGRNVREVYLEGEALFDVVHDVTKPFRVLAKDAVAEDIGTRFDVRAYAEDSVVAVAVAEGAVALGPAGTSRDQQSLGMESRRVILRRGVVGVLAADGRVTTDTGAIVPTYLIWAEGRLRFFKAPLADVARVLSRWYDLDVQVETRALAALEITAEFGAQSADDLLHELALTADCKVTRRGKVVTFQPKS